MEHKLNYGVLLRNVKTESVIEMFHTEVIEDACQFALACFRSLNLPDLTVVVFSLSDGKDIVSFRRS